MPQQSSFHIPINPTILLVAGLVLAMVFGNRWRNNPPQYDDIDSERIDGAASDLTVSENTKKETRYPLLDDETPSEPQRLHYGRLVEEAQPITVSDVANGVDLNSKPSQDAGWITPPRTQPTPMNLSDSSDAIRPPKDNADRNSPSGPGAFVSQPRDSQSRDSQSRDSQSRDSQSGDFETGNEPTVSLSTPVVDGPSRPIVGSEGQGKEANWGPVESIAPRRPIAVGRLPRLPGKSEEVAAPVGTPIEGDQGTSGDGRVLRIGGTDNVDQVRQVQPRIQPVQPGAADEVNENVPPSSLPPLVPPQAMYEDESSDWSPVDLQTAVAAPPRRDHIEVASPRSSMDEESTAIDWQAMDREAASVAAKRAAIERAAAERSAATKFAAAAPLNAQAVRSSELMSGKHLDAAIQFASHRALAAANAELESALRTIAAGADASNTIPIRVNQLSAAMRALVEAEDFLPGSAAIQSGQSARGIAERHRTSVVRMQNREVSATDAVQVYFAFAQQSLLESVGHSRLSSEILYQLGKVCTESRGTSVVVTRAPSARATLFHETALRIDPSNYRSANELAVLLAKAGQWQQAKNYLMHSLSARQLPEAWFNLAKVHDQLGETGLAQRARHEYQLMAGQSAAPNQAAIQWVPPQQFDSAAAPSRPPTNRQRNGFPAQAMTPAPRQQQPNYTGQNSGQTNGDPPSVQLAVVQRVGHHGVESDRASNKLNTFFASHKGSCTDEQDDNTDHSGRDRSLGRRRLELVSVK